MQPHVNGKLHREISISFLMAGVMALLMIVLAPPALALTEIHNVTELQAMQDNLAEDYVLANDIDASETATWNDGAGFAPIGAETTPFTGSLDGQGHVISGLTIHRPDDYYIGLFGYMDTTVQLQNIGLTEADISGKYKTGALVGDSLGTVTQCHASGFVTGSSVVGGLIGFNEGSLVQCHATGEVSGLFEIGGLVGGNGCGGEGIISQCFATSTVSGGIGIGGLLGVDYSGSVMQSWVSGTVSGNQIAGGLAGASYGSIIECYAMGSVSADFYVGGLAGISMASISRCYATGSVSGHTTLGGLVGYNIGTIDSGIINQSYATGAIIGREDAGGLIGKNEQGTVNQCYAMGMVSGNISAGGLVCINNGTVTDSFWGIQTSGQTISGGGTGITTEQLLQSSTFITAGWNYEEVWSQANGQTVPYFASSTPPGTSYALDISVEGNGIVSTTDGSYPAWSLIMLTATAESDHAFAGWLGGGFFSSTPIALNTLPLVMSGDIMMEALFLSSTPISIYTIEDLEKIGKEPAFPLSGEYHIENDIDASATTVWNNGAGFVPIGWQGFPFTGILDGQNHVISGLTIQRPGIGNDYFGLFCCLGQSGQVKNLGMINATVSGYSHLGILAGINYGTVTRCYAAGTVAATDYLSGPEPEEIGIIDPCPSVIEVIGGGPYPNNSHAGGIIGQNKGIVEQCYAAGSVSGDNYLGGIIGTNYGGTVTNSYAKATVSGDNYLGGLIGKDYDGMSMQCYSTGRVEGMDFYFGGMIGYSNHYCMSYCYWDTQTSNQAESWCGEGKTTAEMKQQTTFVGWDFDTVWDIVENVSYPFLRGLPDISEGEEEGAPSEGEIEGMPEGEGVLEGEGPVEGEIEGVIEGEGTPAEGEGTNEGEVPILYHTADRNNDCVIDLSELLRVIQFFNIGGFHCEAGTEDGYAPQPGADHSCTLHQSDYNPQDWIIELSELLRLIQFFNVGGYHTKCDTEDDFAPGPGPVFSCGTGSEGEGESGGEGEGEDGCAVEIVFPDHVLEAAIRDAISKPSGPICDSDLINLTLLNAPGVGITDLTGLEYCTTLEQIDLSYNQIVDIAPLAELIALKDVDLSDNQIVDVISLAEIPSLTSLSLNDNQIIDITPLSGLTNLTQLLLGGNQIISVGSLAGHYSLTSLKLSNNQIVDVSPLGDLLNLTSLMIDNNHLINVSPLADLTSLIWLNLEKNQIANVSPLGDLVGLSLLDLEYNQIVDIQPLASLVNLEALSLSFNLIANIDPLANLTSLWLLSLEKNQITDISALSNCTHIAQLTLSDNQIADISPLTDRKSISYLDLSKNQIDDLYPLDNLTGLLSLYLNNNNITSICPLVDNAGLGANDILELHNNPLGTQSCYYINTLEGRGVQVAYDIHCDRKK